MEDNIEKQSSGKDLKLLFALFNKHKGWILGAVAFMGSISASVTWVYDHFAKQEDLIYQSCERQAIDKDMEIRISKTRNETMIEFSSTIIKMFKEVDPQAKSETTRIWMEQFRDLKDEHQLILRELNAKPNYYVPSVIKKCTKNDPPIIENENGFDTDDFKKILGGIQ